MKLLVITEVPEADGPDAVGNLSTPIGELFVADAMNPLGPPTRLERAGGATLGLVLGLRRRVFERGELLVVDDDGREVSGRMRKPSKWGVKTERFELHQVDAAIARARECSALEVES